MSMWTPLRWTIIIMRSNANPSLFRKAHPHGVRWPTTLLTACLSPSWAEAWRWLWGTSSKSPPPSTTPLRRGLCPPDSVGSTHWEGVVKSLWIRGFNHWPQVRQWRGEMHCLQAVWGCVPCSGTRSTWTFWFYLFLMILTILKFIMLWFFLSLTFIISKFPS